MNIDFNGNVYSVGDGFCYEGIIFNYNNGRSEYHFVIDCGSQAPNKKCCKKGMLSKQADCNNRLQEISMQITSNSNTIDLFILTHLHKDHFNGMKVLFNNAIPNTIIMPYLYPEERLYYIVSDDNNNDNNLDDEDIEFLSDPYNNILSLAQEKNPNARLILVRGNSYADGENNLYSDNILWGERHEDEEEIKNIEGINSPAVKVVRTTSEGIQIHKFVWMFKLFNLEVDKNKIDALKRIVGNLTSINLCSIINDKVKLRSFKNQYEIISKSLYKDLNNTSIVVYHAPIHSYNRNGTMITGDINLNHGIYAQILEYFEREIPHIGLFSVPHHGSVDNWNIQFIQNNNLDDTVCFVSTHNYYTNRMTPTMMSDLRCHNISSLVVDENRFSEFEQFIRILGNYDSTHIIQKGNNKWIDIRVD